MVDATAESTPKDESSSSTTQSDEAKSKRRRWMPFILAPYLIGIAWHAIHPVASIFTGDFKAARGWYIDENSLEPSYFRMDAKYDILKHKRSGTFSMCQALAERGGTSESVSCHRLEHAIDVAEILPTSTAVSPTSEAIVLVIPSTENWQGSQFHFSVLQLIQRLSSPSTAPWLSKTILVVSPVQRPAHTYTLQETVDTFLENYLGSRKQSTNTTIINTGAKSSMIRNLLVLDINMTNTGSSTQELRILPQGRRGVLPNMDLVWLTVFCYSRATFLNPHRNPQTNVVITMHSYQNVAQDWLNYLKPRLPPRLYSWIKGLRDLLLFEYSLALGPSPPHAEALDRGIDALTIQGHFSGSRQQASAAELVQKMEYIMRPLSNLHERLHHSTSLYLLPSSERFVKHEEYLVPNLLLVIPCIIRAITLVLLDIPRLDLSAIGRSLSIAAVGTALVAFGVPLVEWMDDEFWWFFSDRMNACNMAVLAIYLSIFSLTISGKAESTARQSIQFVSCLLLVYVHVPIAFGHVSLAFPSALLWTPLIAFPSFHEKAVGRVKRFFGLAILVALCPAIYLVPNVVPSYTPYVKYAYLPLHLVASVLWNT